MATFRVRRRPTMRLVLGMLIAVGLVSWLLIRYWRARETPRQGRLSAASATQLLVAGDCELIGIVDGRTLLVRQDEREFEVRLLGVAPPEGPFAEVARQALAAEAPLGPAFLEFDKRRSADDGTWLAYVHISGRLVNLAPLRAGGCRHEAYPGDSLTIARQLRSAEASAQAERLGLWQAVTAPE
ncbi:MAG: thermonuclease family protein [Pirellulaceae bacterium]|nr:thermonuclease family protein [Pirellulaceae bacterium]